MDTFGVADGGYVRVENEREALCDSKMSKISPLSGGDIVFSTLEGKNVLSITDQKNKLFADIKIFYGLEKVKIKKTSSQAGCILVDEGK